MNTKDNENTILKLIKSDKKKEVDLKRINTKNICIIVFIFIFLMISFYEIYLLKININQINKIISQNKKDNKNHDINLIEPYIKAQKEFCDNQNKFINQEYENHIILSNVKFKEFNFKMYVFKARNFLLDQFKRYNAFEIPNTNYMIQAIEYYSSKYNIKNNKDIFILDIGGNVGWYPTILGRYGYTILSFEALDRNYYVAKKNVCKINKNSNIILINKGLGNIDKKCNYFNHRNNAGNGMVICDDTNSKNNTRFNNSFIKQSEIQITTLKNFLPYLSDKRIVLMKIDVEGNELNVLEGGKELITEYHVPFIVLELSPIFLKMVGSSPKKLVHLLVDNGYKISLKGFLSKEYLTIEELFEKIKFQIDCYFIYDIIK